ncbi:hypothetical protein ACLB2K_067152 [Fragaria x ananassa]
MQKWKKPRHGAIKLNIDGAINVRGGNFGTGLPAFHREIEVAAKNVVKKLDAAEVDLSADGGLVEQAKVLISHIQFCSWRYVPLDCNKAAHCVAKMALSVPFPTYWWLQVPVWLSSVIVADASS